MIFFLGVGCISVAHIFCVISVVAVGCVALIVGTDHIVFFAVRLLLELFVLLLF